VPFALDVYLSITFHAKVRTKLWYPNFLPTIFHTNPVKIKPCALSLSGPLKTFKLQKLNVII
jgi:hypothetical protein